VQKTYFTNKLYQLAKKTKKKKRKKNAKKGVFSVFSEIFREFSTFFPNFLPFDFRKWPKRALFCTGLADANFFLPKKHVKSGFFFQCVFSFLTKKLVRRKGKINAKKTPKNTKKKKREKH
jgi:hypothetical protein